MQWLARDCQRRQSWMRRGWRLFTALLGGRSRLGESLGADDGDRCQQRHKL
jgi:hypothetical protein